MPLIGLTPRAATKGIATALVYHISPVHKLLPGWFGKGQRPYPVVFVGLVVLVVVKGPSKYATDFLKVALLIEIYYARSVFLLIAR